MLLDDRGQVGYVVLDGGSGAGLGRPLVSHLIDLLVRDEERLRIVVVLQGQCLKVSVFAILIDLLFCDLAPVHDVVHGEGLVVRTEQLELRVILEFGVHGLPDRVL